MTTEVRELLREGAASPKAEVDVAAVMQVAEGRRRRRRGIVAAVVAIVLAVATLGVVRAADNGGTSAQVAIGPRQSSEYPEGWTPVELDSGIRFAMPPGWDSYDFGDTPVAERRIAVGTARPTDTSVLTACGDVGQHPTEAGTWLSIWEYPGFLGSGVTAPLGDVLGIVDRPTDFRDLGPTGTSCPYAGNATAGELGAAFEMFAFRDAGRVFVARVITAYPAGGTPNFSQADQVLNSLRISPLEPATTIPATTVPVTTAPPSVPATTDEQEITRLFVEWQRVHTDDEIRASVEDADALLDAIHEGMAQHSEADLAKYAGRVEAIRMTDADHAVVDYTLLFDGQPQFGVRAGTAVRIDGVWKVSRDTECELLALGGVTCPARANS